MRKLLQLALLGLLLAWCAPAKADIAFSGSVGSACVTTGSPITISSFAVTSGDMILVSVHQRNEDITVSVSGGGLTWTQIDNVDQTQNFIGVDTWRATAASTDTFDITVTITSNNQVAWAIAQAFSGVDTTTDDGVEAFSSTAGPGTDNNDMLWSVTTGTANAWAVAMGSTLNTTLTIPGEETDIATNTTGCSSSFKAHMWYQGPVATPAATQLGALNDLSGNNDWCMTVVSLKPSGGGPPAAVPQRMMMGVGQ